jgi:hypothetical protein
LFSARACTEREIGDWITDGIEMSEAAKAARRGR